MFFKDIFSEQSNIPKSDWLNLSQRLKQVEIAKKTILLKQGSVENKIFYIKSGIARYYVLHKNTDTTIAFSLANEYVSAYDSFITRKPSFYQIETLTNTKLWYLTYQDVLEMREQTISGQEIGRLIAESLFIKKLKREQALLTQTAEERYMDLLTNNPQLLQQIPLRYIASYIGITPQALSRIRKRIS